MQQSIAITKSTIAKYVLVDLVLLISIYLIPAISHLNHLPIYMFEPMRFVLILSLIFTNRTNTIIIASSIPVFSFLFASHPDILKSLLIGFELSINIVLFYYFVRKYKSVFISMTVSIILAKIFYYALKYILIKIGLVNGMLITTPIYIQLILIIILSLVVFISFKSGNRKFI